MIEDFVKDELKDYTIYKELAKMEKDRNFKKILNHLSRHEFSHYKFFLGLSKKKDKDFKVNKFEIFLFKLLRKIFGLTFTLKFLEKHESDVVKTYEKHAKRAKGKIKKKWEKIIRDEKFHERSILSKIDEERVRYTGSIILGLNDGLVELIGTLAGLTAALQDNLIVGISGLIAGIAASLSMSSSSYLQAKQENKDPKKSAFYTGISYITIVLLLIFPFFIFKKILYSLSTSIIISVLSVISIALYLSVLFERNFKRQLLEMFIFSLGIAAFAFLIGTLAKILFGISI
jgi:VIT1/CCC1 family predicted Fe2+/Mn2+ transporter